MIKISKILAVVVLSGFVSCVDMLNEETFSTLGPTNFYNTAEDAEALLNGVYARSQGYRDAARNLLTFGENCTDIMIERGGAINAHMQPIEDFDFVSTHAWSQWLWTRYYSAIFRANTVIDNVPGIEMNESRRDQIVAEARFLRAFNYFYLYDLFGPVPIIESSNVSVTDRPERPTDEAFFNFMESEFLAVSQILPAVQTQFGRAAKGAALGFLCKLYLNKKKWQDAASMAQDVMSLGVYSIFTEGNRTDLFKLENKGHSEFIYVHPFPDNEDSGFGNTYLSHAAPPGYRWQNPPKTIFAANFRIRTAFINTFEPEDERLDAFLFGYVNQDGETVVLGQDDARSFKYPEDPNATGDVSSDDFPLLRYADILLSRAEALNELNGPNQESFDLVNVIRSAAGVSSIGPDDTPTKEQLRDFILAERGREFHTEGLRRQDLIRHGKFISLARARGKAAEDHHVLYPIPQNELDKNQNLVQNDGY